TAVAACVLVPNPAANSVRLRPIDGWGEGIPVSATWMPAENGYTVAIRVPGIESGTVVDLDVIVNERPASRERRRGQLVLSGGAGEFVYLRGDRHDANRLIPMLITDD